MASKRESLETKKIQIYIAKYYLNKIVIIYIVKILMYNKENKKSP